MCKIVNYKHCTYKPFLRKCFKLKEEKFKITSSPKNKIFYEDEFKIMTMISLNKLWLTGYCYRSELLNILYTIIQHMKIIEQYRRVNYFSERIYDQNSS